MKDDILTEEIDSVEAKETRAPGDINQQFPDNDHHSLDNNQHFPDNTHHFPIELISPWKQTIRKSLKYIPGNKRITKSLKSPSRNYRLAVFMLKNIQDIDHWERI